MAKFAYWINPKEEYIEDSVSMDLVKKTLQKTNGDWAFDTGLEGKLTKYAQIDATTTLDILELYLLNKEKTGINQNRRYPMFSIDNEIKSALVIIYNDTALQPKVENMINLLVEFGGQIYWGLKLVPSAGIEPTMNP